MNRAVGYIRVSTDKDKQANSLAAQPETIRRYAKMQGLDLVEILQDEVSALKVPFFDRESGERILELIRKKVIQHVIGAKVDRLFRDAQDGLSTADWLLARGVNMHVIDTGGVINVGDPAGRMMFTMLLAVAEFEPRRISQRTKEALGVMRKAGKKIGKVPYGFHEAEGKLEQMPEEVAICAEIRDRHKNGERLKRIADDLNARKVPTKEGGKWHPSTVRQIARRKDVEL
jgi:site-specific DNA recombinase